MSPTTSDGRHRAALTALEVIARERARVTAPAVFACLALFIVAFPAMGFELAYEIKLFEIAVLTVLGGLALAIFLRRIPLRWAHAASAATLEIGRAQV